MQGHNSWLWNLILGNMGNLLEEVMTKGVNGGTKLHECLQYPESH